MAGMAIWVCPGLSLRNHEYTDSWCIVNTLGNLIGICGAIPCCIICPNPYRSVSQGNVGLVTKFGRFYRATDPGLVKINPLSERLLQVDVKIQIVGKKSPPETTQSLLIASDRGAQASLHDQG